MKSFAYLWRDKSVREFSFLPLDPSREVRACTTFSSSSGANSSSWLDSGRCGSIISRMNFLIFHSIWWCPFLMFHRVDSEVGYKFEFSNWMYRKFQVYVYYKTNTELGMAQLVKSFDSQSKSLGFESSSRIFRWMWVSLKFQCNQITVTKLKR